MFDERTKACPKCGKHDELAALPHGWLYCMRCKVRYYAYAKDKPTAQPGDIMEHMEGE